MLESIPCFYLTVYAGIRVARIHKVQSTQRSSIGFSGHTRTDPFAASVPTMLRMPQPGMDEDTDVDGWTKLSNMSPASTHERSPSSANGPGKHAKQTSVTLVEADRKHGKSPSQTTQARFHMPFKPSQDAVSPTSTAIGTYYRDCKSPFAYPTVVDDAIDVDVENGIGKHSCDSHGPMRLDSACFSDDL